MKRMSMFLLLVSLSLMTTSCTTASPEPFHNQYQITLTDVFKHQHSHSIYQFEKITEGLSNVQDKENLAYILGMIDSNLIDNPVFLPVIILTNDETKQIIADEQLQSGVLTFYQYKKDYLKKLQALLEQNDLTEIQNKREELKKLSTLMPKINDDRLFDNDKTKIESYKKDLELVLQQFPK
ncbi:hypothetical protein [Brevibacillus sp. SAFN-007a]|uniref:hypothetical protein n=1 Tax=Brevibacillus sp. SAFN-007a TaxID=3436862 RepID=UPI003F7D5305